MYGYQSNVVVVVVVVLLERHLFFQVTKVNFLMHLKFPFFEVDVTTKFCDSMMLNFLNNLLNILMIFK